MYNIIHLKKQRKFFLILLFDARVFKSLIDLLCWFLFLHDLLGRNQVHFVICSFLLLILNFIVLVVKCDFLKFGFILFLFDIVLGNFVVLTLFCKQLLFLLIKALRILLWFLDIILVLNHEVSLLSGHFLPAFIIFLPKFQILVHQFLI